MNSDFCSDKDGRSVFHLKLQFLDFLPCLFPSLIAHRATLVRHQIYSINYLINLPQSEVWHNRHRRYETKKEINHWYFIKLSLVEIFELLLYLTTWKITFTPIPNTPPQNSYVLRNSLIHENSENQPNSAQSSAHLCLVQ